MTIDQTSNDYNIFRRLTLLHSSCQRKQVNSIGPSPIISITFNHDHAHTTILQQTYGCILMQKWMLLHHSATIHLLDGVVNLQLHILANWSIANCSIQFQMEQINLNTNIWKQSVMAFKKSILFQIEQINLTTDIWKQSILAFFIKFHFISNWTNKSYNWHLYTICRGF